MRQIHDNIITPVKRTRKSTLAEKVEKKEKPDPQRVAFLRMLPPEIKQQITGEEAEAFMYNRELPDTLMEKLKDYLVDTDE